MKKSKIYYGINIINHENKLDTKSITNALDLKFIKYDFNKKTDDFVDMIINKNEGNFEYVIDKKSFFSLGDVIDYYNVVPKLFEKNLIDNNYEKRLNQLEHLKDIEKEKIIKKYNNLFNKNFNVLNGINSIYEWYTGAVYFKDYEWNEIDDNNKLKKLFLAKNEDSYIYSLPLDFGLLLRSYKIYYYFSTNVSRFKKPTINQIRVWFLNITDFLEELKVILPTYKINSDYDRRLLLGVVDNLRNIILLLTNAELMTLSENGMDFIYDKSCSNSSLNTYFELIEKYQTVIEGICFRSIEDKLNLNIINDIIKCLINLKDNTLNKIQSITDEFILSKSFNPLREIDNYVENYIVCKSIVKNLNLSKKKFNLISILYGSLELPFIIKRLCNSNVDLSFLFQNHGMYLDRQNKSLLEIDEDLIEYGKLNKRVNTYIIDDNMMSGVTMQLAYNKLFINGYKNIKGIFVIRHPNVNRIAQLEHFDVALNLELVDKFIYGLLTETPYSKIKRNTNLNNMFVNELNIFSIMTEVFLKALYCNNSFIQDSQVDIFKGYSEGKNDKI